MKKFVSSNALLIIGLLLGAVTGYIYWKYVGCISGTCPITSVWYNTTIYGAVMGALLLSMFKKEPTKETEE